MNQNSEPTAILFPPETTPSIPQTTFKESATPLLATGLRDEMGYIGTLKPKHESVDEQEVILIWGLLSHGIGCPLIC